MKSALLKFLWLSIALWCVGCEDFLTVEPRDELSRTALLGTRRGADAAVVGLYALLGTENYYRTRMTIYADVAGNMDIIGDGALVNPADAGAARQESLRLYGLLLGADYVNSNYDDLYDDAYTALYQANDVIDALATITDAPEEVRLSLRAEALTVRAVAHFDLVRLFAQAPGFTPDASHPGVVLVTSVPKVFDAAARASVAEVYASVISDLEAAEATIDPGFSERLAKPYWINRDIIRALLARVNAYAQNWAATQRWATLALEESSSSRAGAPYWELDLQRFRKNDGLPVISSPAQVVGAGNPSPYLQVAQSLVDLYGADDARRALIVTDTAGVRLSLKYPFAANAVRNAVVVRRADIVLLRAEANLELGRRAEALADLHVSQAAANATLSRADLSDEALRNAILLERRKELAFEGHYLFDLGRRGRSLSRGDCPAFVRICEVPYPDRGFILAIPQDAIVRNPGLTQNPDY